MKKPRNKKYRPRQIQADPVSWAVAGVHNFPFATVDESFRVINTYVSLLKQGKARREDWNFICQMLNTAEALAQLAVGQNLLPQIRAGQDALKAIALRMIERGPTACYARELAAIDEALFMHRAQMSACTQAEYGRAVQKVKRTLMSGGADDMVALYEKMCAPEREAA